MATILPVRLYVCGLHNNAFFMLSNTIMRPCVASHQALEVQQDLHLL
jgi:hypothetical protein